MLITTIILAATSTGDGGAVSGGGSRLPLEAACEFPAPGADFYTFQLSAPPDVIDLDGNTSTFFFANLDGMHWDDRGTPWRRVKLGEVLYTEATPDGLSITVKSAELGTAAEVATLENLPRIVETAKCYRPATLDYPWRGLSQLRGLCVFETWNEYCE